MRKQYECSRRSFLAGLAAAGAAEAAFSAPTRKKIRGTVTCKGTPVEGVPVSDGLAVVLTDEKGRFLLEVGPHSGPFVFVTTPRGYWTDEFSLPVGAAWQAETIHFHLLPKAQSEDFSFVFWTDIHLESGGDTLGKFQKSVAETNSLAPAFVWAQGDITVEGNAGKRYRELCKALRMPIRNGAGNHEMRVWEKGPRKVFWTLFGPTYYSFRWAGVHCVVLDGNNVISRKRHWTSVRGAVSKRELAWLANDLAAKPHGMPVIVGIHIPLLTTYTQRRGISKGETTPWVIENANEVCDILAAHSTRLVLQGHLHENERLRRGPIEFVTSQALSGSWWGSGAGFERGVDNAPRGYRVVQVKGGRIRHFFYPSCESHVKEKGELWGVSQRRPHSHDVFVFNWFDAPPDPELKARIDRAPWRTMEQEPAVNPRQRLIMPHHFFCESSTAHLTPGRHVLELELRSSEGSTRQKAAFSISEPGRPKVSVLYCTDLFHPPVDPDDHFDAACLFALNELDIKGVVLENTARQRKRRGRHAIEQLCAITGKKVPVRTGLSRPLKGPADTGRDQSPASQQAVEHILKVLQESAEPVVVITVGSLRDIAAAYNRNPLLCHRKIERLYAFCGDAHSAPGFRFREYNVSLDPNAFRCIMRSGLPVYWVPCFDGGDRTNRGRASWWRAPHAELLKNAADPVKQYFIYALLREKTADPLAFLRQPVDPEKWKKVLSGRRNLWCCAVFCDCASGKIVREGSAFRTVPLDQPGANATPFTFERVFVDVDPSGMILYPTGPARYPVNRFKITDKGNYASIMTQATADLLSLLCRPESPHDRGASG